MVDVGIRMKVKNVGESKRRGLNKARDGKNDVICRLIRQTKR